MLSDKKTPSFRLISGQKRRYLLGRREILRSVENLRGKYRRSKIEADLPAMFVWQRMPNGYRIASLEEDKFLEALNFIRECFFENEPMCKVTGLSNDGTSMTTYIEIIYKKMADLQSLYACREGDNKLVGVAIASINRMGDCTRAETRIRPHQGKALFDIMTLKSCVFARANPYEALEIEHFFRVHVFCVDVKHQSKGIGTALINSCIDRARSLLAPACVIGASSAPARALSQKLGFTLLAKISYDDFKVYDDETESFEYPFENLTDHSMTCMALKIALPSPPSEPKLLTSRSSKKKKPPKKLRSILKRK